MKRLLPLVLALGLLAGCASPATNSTPVSATKLKPTAKKPAPTGQLTITGAVTAPAGIIATGGGNIIAAGGGNYRALAVAEQPLAGSRVYLADASGAKVAGVAETKTDAKGAYSLAGVPKGGPYMVVAEGKTAEGKDAPLRTVVKPEAGALKADLGAATTMMATKLLKDGNGTIKGFEANAWNQAVMTLAADLTADMLPADLSAMSDMAMIGGMFSSFSEKMPALKTALSDLAAAVPAAQEGVDQAQEELDRAQEELDRAQEELEKASNAAGVDLGDLGSLF